VGVDKTFSFSPESNRADLPALYGAWWETMSHKFKVGQLVDYYPPRGIYAPRGSYIITAQLPRREGEFEYQIKHTKEVHERIATESQMTMAQVTASSAEITEYMGYQLEARPLGKGWRVLIYPPGSKSALPEYASDLEKASKEVVIRRAKEIIEAHLNRTLRRP
jgi:hypothetical protein